MLNAGSQGKFLTELYVRAHVTDEMILESASLRASRLLFEQINVEGTVENVKKTKADLLKVLQFFEGEGAASLVSVLDKLVKSIPDPSKLYASAYGEDENKVKALSKDFTDKMMKANLGFSSAINAMTELKKALVPFYEELDDNSRKMTIGELCDSKDPSVKFIPRDKILAGMKKAFIPQKTFKDAFKKGSEMAQRGSEGKSKLGKLFATATKFLGGFFAKPPGEAFPKLLEAFSEYVFSSSLDEFFKSADKITVKGKEATFRAGQVAGETSSEAGALAGGAKPADGSAEKTKKVKSDELEKELGGDDKAKAFIAALKSDDSTKALFEEGCLRGAAASKRTLFFEAISYKDLLAIAQKTKGIEKEDADKIAAKAARLLKSKGADVDDTGAPQDAGGDEKIDDIKDIEPAVIKAGEEAKAAAANSTMGKAIHKAVINYVQPFYDRKSLSAKKKEELQKSVEDDLSSVLNAAADDSGKNAIKSFKDAMEMWFNGLDPSLQKNLGGPVGSKKLMQKAAKNIEDVITTNFKVEESSRNKKPVMTESVSRSENELIDRWQKLAGIK